MKANKTGYISRIVGDWLSTEMAERIDFSTNTIMCMSFGKLAIPTHKPNQQLLGFICVSPPPKSTRPVV